MTIGKIKCHASMNETNPTNDMHPLNNKNKSLTNIDNLFYTILTVLRNSGRRLVSFIYETRRLIDN
jgi:hypothetical protein